MTSLLTDELLQVVENNADINNVEDYEYYRTHISKKRKLDGGKKYIEDNKNFTRTMLKLHRDYISEEDLENRISKKIEKEIDNELLKIDFLDKNKDSYRRLYVNVLSVMIERKYITVINTDEKFEVHITDLGKERLISIRKHKNELV